MAVISELIRSESDGTISFGDYTKAEKSKLDDFKHAGDVYKVKTFKEITKLERNGMFVYESVPGTSVERLSISEDGVAFQVEGAEDAKSLSIINCKKPSSEESLPFPIPVSLIL